MMHNTGITGDTAEVASLAVDGPQPVWMTLNAARERAFTGEIVFGTDPEVFAYLDNGMVYYAERASDVSLGGRLLRAGVVDMAQLECGTVRVGDIEHLGRLFDRDPSIDRDAVIVLAETTTQELITELANRTIATARFTAYRHHPSGVHRWFVAPLDPVAKTRPVSAVAQLDTNVLDDLPALSFDGADGDELVIEWDDDIDDIPQPHTDVLELSSGYIEFTEDSFIDVEAFADLDTFIEADTVIEPDTVIEAEMVIEADTVIEVADAAAVIGAAPADHGVVSDAGEAARGDFEFSVVWPDGPEESAPEAPATVEESMTSLGERSDLAADAAPAAEVDAVLLADDGTFRFTMPPLELSDEPDRAGAEVPDDVAEAVRRAIAAIESADVVAPEADSGAELLTEPPTANVSDLASTALPPAGAPARLNSFAPPTMATHAEVLYAEMRADESLFDAALGIDNSDDDDSANERKSALRRLIGSLRRKDS